MEPEYIFGSWSTYASEPVLTALDGGRPAIGARLAISAITRKENIPITVSVLTISTTNIGRPRRAPRPSIAVITVRSSFSCMKRTLKSVRVSTWAGVICSIVGVSRLTTDGLFLLVCSKLHRLRVVRGGTFEAWIGARGNGELPMNDAQRYRTNAAECLSAAESCESPYHGLTLAIAASWVSLARQQKAMDELLAIWKEAGTEKLADTNPRRFQYPRDLRNPSAFASTRYAALPTPRAKLAGELFAAAGLR
jgi:hypothetical protein